MNQHQNQVLKMAFQQHWNRHSLKYAGILISLMAFYFWNMARETVQTPYQIVLLDEDLEQLGLENIELLTIEHQDKTRAIEKPAQPVGGYKAFYGYLSQHLTYPQEAYEQGVQGKVYVQFVVAIDGSIGSVKTLKGIGYGCDAEAEKIIRNSPKWNPATHKGEILKQTMVLPIQFGKK